MSSDDKTPRFALLNESNYPYWVIRMEAQLVKLGLWEIVVYEEEDGSEEDSKKARETWRKKRTAKKMSEARAEIILRVEDSQLAHVRDRDPALIWGALARVHIARGFATRLALRRQFMRMVKGNEESMAAWVGRVKAFSFRVEDAGVDLTDEDRILVLTNGLNESYESFVISLDAKPTDELTLEHVVDRLLNEEVRRDNKGNGTEVKKEAYLVRGAGGGGGGGSGNGGKPGGEPGTCWRCGKPGHIRMYCNAEVEPGLQGSNAPAEKEVAHLAWTPGASYLRELSPRMVGHVI